MEIKFMLLYNLCCLEEKIYRRINTNIKQVFLNVQINFFNYYSKVILCYIIYVDCVRIIHNYICFFADFFSIMNCACLIGINFWNH